MKPMDIEKRMCVRTVSYAHVILIFVFGYVGERIFEAYLQNQSINLRRLRLRFPMILSPQRQQSEIVIKETDHIGQCKHLLHIS